MNSADSDDAALGAHQRREALFHDQWARQSDPTGIDVDAFFEAPTAVENRFIRARMGPLRGKRILDIGCGLGEASVYFARHGALVTATDVAPQMVETTRHLARLHGVTLNAVVSSAEELNVADEAYDFVYVANTIHHAASRERLFGEIRRALAPGGRFFSWDPLAYNPVINVYRRMARHVRTRDEAPLTRADVQLARRYFEDVETRMFWLFSLALFVKYFVWDRIHPDAQRYWKLVYQKQPLWWWRPLRNIDAVVCRLPGFRWLAWNIIISGRKPTAPR